MGQRLLVGGYDVLDALDRWACTIAVDGEAVTGLGFTHEAWNTAEAEDWEVSLATIEL